MQEEEWVVMDGYAAVASDTSAQRQSRRYPLRNRVPKKYEYYITKRAPGGEQVEGRIAYLPTPLENFPGFWE